MDMTEQQQHLVQLIQQRDAMSRKSAETRDLLLKLQGAIDYLTQIGVTLPEPPVEEPTEPGVESEETTEEE